jgi:deazaflavin-dependent oxidoreductase (nitroreductase family)
VNFSGEWDEETISAIKAMNTSVVDEFRANEGRVGGKHSGTPLLLLHTKGHKTGTLYLSPMIYLRLDERVFVFASKGGADSNPDWYKNALRDSNVYVEIGDDAYAAKAKPLEGVERDRVYAIQGSRFPNFIGYQQQTMRTIPVVEIVRL